MAVKSMTLRGLPRHNYYAGKFPAAKGYFGSLPAGREGFDFYTLTPPQRGIAEWSLDELGVTLRVIEGEEFAEIVIVPMRVQKSVAVPVR